MYKVVGADRREYGPVSRETILEWIAQGRANEAVSVMEQALRNDDSPPVRKRYGDALLMAKRYDDAIEQYDAALRQNPRYLAALKDKTTERSVGPEPKAHAVNMTAAR